MLGFNPNPLFAVIPTGYYRPSPTAEYTEDSPGGNFDFFSCLVSSWEAAAVIPDGQTRGVLVRSGKTGHHACLEWLCFGAGAVGEGVGEVHQIMYLVLLGCDPRSIPLRIVSWL